jgi:hypothetical protein
MYVIKLPKLHRFESKRENIGPYEKFYKWLCSTLPLDNYITLYGKHEEFNIPRGFRLDVCKIGVCEEDDKIFQEIVKRWIKIVSLKNYKGVYRINAKFIKSAMAFYNLECAPKVYRKINREANFVPGYVYVEKDFLLKANGDEY